MCWRKSLGSFQLLSNEETSELNSVFNFVYLQPDVSIHLWDEVRSQTNDIFKSLTSRSIKYRNHVAENKCRHQFPLRQILPHINTKLTPCDSSSLMFFHLSQYECSMCVSHWPTQCLAPRQIDGVLPQCSCNPAAYPFDFDTLWRLNSKHFILGSTLHDL